MPSSSLSPTVQIASLTHVQTAVRGQLTLLASDDPLHATLAATLADVQARLAALYDAAQPGAGQ